MHRSVVAAVLVLAWAPRASAQFGPPNADTAARAFLSSGGAGVSVGSGARAYGMGGAFIAVADDATASSWNPAGLGVLERAEVSVVWKAREHHELDYGPSVTVFETESLSSTSHDAGSLHVYDVRALDFMSATYPLRLGGFKLVPQMNYQHAVERGYDERVRRRPTTLREDHRRASGGDAITTGSSVFDRAIDSNGGIDVWALSVAGSRTDRLSIGLSLNWWRQRTWGTTFQESAGSRCSASARPGCDDFVATRRTSFHSESSGVNLNVGVLWRPKGPLRIGFVLKTPFAMRMDSLEGSTDRTEHRDGAPEVSFANVSEAATLRWPLTVGIGLALQPRDAFTVAADMSTTAWSKASYAFVRDVRTLDTAAPSGGLLTRHETGSTQWPVAGQTNSYQARLGLEYLLLKRRLVIPLRAGAYLERQYASSEVGDSVFFRGVTLGTGVGVSALALDVAVLHRWGLYPTGFTRVSPGFFEQRRENGNEFSSDRLFVSAIVRF